MARQDHTRGLRDEANVGPDPRAARELRRLSELRFKVADGEPDIRGWSVYASSGRELGRVDDLLVDVEAGEVVMLDVDLRRDDRHAYAPIRAAWVDHGTRRVVLDVRSVEGMTDRDDLLPTLPRRAALTDDEVDRFDAGYARAYGDRGLERDHAWRLRHGEDELRFGRPADRDARHVAGGLAAGAAALGAHRSDRVAERTTTDPGEPWDGGRTVRPEDRAPRRLLDPHDASPTRRMDASGPVDLPSPQPPQAHGAHFDESHRVNAELAGLDAERRAAARDGTADDARTLADDRAITPMELDAQVRMAEGGHVDDRTPVQGVRYDGATHEPHDYGRPDERYGAEYGSGRIGFDRVVTRRRWNDDDASRTAPHGDLAPRDRVAGDHLADDRGVRADAFPSGDVGAGLGAGGMAAGTAPGMADATGTTRPSTPSLGDAPAHDALAHDPARLPADRVGRDPRDRDADGHVSLGERLRDTLGDVRDRLRGDDADDARRVRYRRYDDGYDPGTPHR